MQWIAGAGVRREARLCLSLGDEIDFVDDDVRGEGIGFGNDEKPIEHPRMRLGPRRGEDDDHLIHVRGDDAFAVRATRRSPRQPRPSRQDLADGPAAAARVGLDEHFVTDRQLQSITVGLPTCRVA